jgi:hypothetical protein
VFVPAVNMISKFHQLIRRLVWLREGKGRDVPLYDIGLLGYVFGVQDGVDEGMFDFYIRTHVFVARPTQKYKKIN